MPQRSSSLGVPRSPKQRRCKAGSSGTSTSILRIRDSANAALLDPLLTGSGQRPDQQERPSITTLCVRNCDLNREILAPQSASFSDVKREETCVLFGSFHRRVHPEVTNSEIYLQRELDDPPISGRKNSPECGGLTTDVWRTEVRTIECIEQLGSELKVTILVEMNILGDRKVEVCKAWSTHNSHASISESLRRRTRHGEGVRVKPTLDSSLRPREFRVSNEVRAAYPIAAQIQNRRPADSRRQRQSTLNHVDSGYLPVPEQQIGHPIPRPAPMPVTPPRQFVNVADREAMFEIELRWATLRLEIVRILRRAENTDIDSGATKTGR